MHGNHYRYNTEKNPFGKPIQFLMKHKDKIVGSHSIRPLQFRIKDKIVLGGMTYDSLTDPDYQNMGIFTELVNATHTEAKKQNYQFVCGYANAKSIGTYQKELKHKKLQEINFIKITDFEKVKEPEEIRVCKKKIPEEIETLLNKNDKQFACSISKDIQYLQWRYEQKHHEKYYIYFQQESFFIITKQFEKQEQIVDFVAKDAVAFRRALTIVSNIAKSDVKKDLTMWIPANHHLLKEAEIKYETLIAKQFFHVISFNDTIEQYILDSDNWNYSMGDSDVF